MNNDRVIDATNNFRKVLSHLGRLREIKDIYGVDLLHVQRYLYSRHLPPTSMIELEYDGGRWLKKLRVIDDEDQVGPPPFKPLHFRIEVSGQPLTPNPSTHSLQSITVAERNRSVKKIEGCEREIFSRFQEYLTEADPDILITSQAEEVTVPYLEERARTLGIDFRLGREGLMEGRILLDFADYASLGLAGPAEKSRFALAPPRLVARWPAGRTVDSRQCYEALKKGILIPRNKGFTRISTAREIAERDRGGLILSPKVGFHENVAELDFESQHPNIIIKHNLSYEAVTPKGVDGSRRGFLAELIQKI